MCLAVLSMIITFESRGTSYLRPSFKSLCQGKEEMIKNTPTEKQLKRQLTVAILMSLVAIIDGVVMVLEFSPVMVLMEILLVALALLQWIFYYNIKTQFEFYTVIRNQEKA